LIDLLRFAKIAVNLSQLDNYDRTENTNPKKDSLNKITRVIKQIAKIDEEQK